MNHSLRGAVALNVNEVHHRGLFEAALASADGCFMVVVAVSPRRLQSIAIDGSLLLIAMLMLSPMTSRSHYVELLPYLTLLALNWRDQHTGRHGRAVLLTSFALVTLDGNDAVGQAFTVWAYRHSAMVLGTPRVADLFRGVGNRTVTTRAIRSARCCFPSPREAVGSDSS